LILCRPQRGQTAYLRHQLLPELSGGLVQEAQLHRAQLAVLGPGRLVGDGVHALIDGEEDGARAHVEERGLEYARRLHRARRRNQGAHDGRIEPGPGIHVTIVDESLPVEQQVSRAVARGQFAQAGNVAVDRPVGGDLAGRLEEAGGLERARQLRGHREQRHTALRPVGFGDRQDAQALRLIEVDRCVEDGAQALFAHSTGAIALEVIVGQRRRGGEIGRTQFRAQEGMGTAGLEQEEQSGCDSRRHGFPPFSINARARAGLTLHDGAGSRRKRRAGSRVG